MACVELIQEAIRLSQFLKTKPELTQPAANVLASIVNLLPTIELIQCSETLLAQKDDEVRLVAVGSVFSRAKEISNPSSDDVVSLLSFVAKLITLLSESTDVVLCSQAITCIAQIIKRFGKTNTSLVISAAQVIVSERALKHVNNQVQLASVACLTTAAKILRDEFIPLVPAVLPTVYSYLEHSLSTIDSGEKTALLLMNGCFAFAHTLVENLPFLVTGDYLDTLLQLLIKTANSELVSAKLKAPRAGLWRLLAKTIGADEMFSALGRNWEKAKDSEDVDVGFLLCVQN
jgi:U3 small nucleolar RNA-associated protein 10